MLGSVDRGHVFRLIEALAQGDGKTVVETSEALRIDGMSAASTLEEMTAVLQAMAVLQAVPSRAEAAASATDPDAADTRAARGLLMPADETQLLYSLCLHGRGELGLAPDEYAALTMVLLRLLAFKPSPERGRLGLRGKTLNDAPAAAPAPVAAPAQPPRPIPVRGMSAEVPRPAPVSMPRPRSRRPPPCGPPPAGRRPARAPPRGRPPEDVHR